MAKKRKNKKEPKHGKDPAPSEQLQWYFDHAEAGDEQAMRQLGRMYAHGFTHPEDSHVEICPDRDEARRWLTKAADAGDGEAALLLGMLCDGEATDGAFDEPDEAFRRYQQAVDLEYRPALTYLGSRYLIGRGTDRNDLLAREILIEAAYAGDEPAQRLVAAIYDKDGDGTRATAWLIARSVFHDEKDMPKAGPKDSLEVARLLIQKVNIYSKLVLCDAPELIQAGDVLRQAFIQEI
jgi:TPR repeat protein